MNMAAELERIRQQNGAGGVKSYSADEARELLERGEITPPEKIHKESHGARISVPNKYGRGNYGFGMGL